MRKLVFIGTWLVLLLHLTTPAVSNRSKPAKVDSEKGAVAVDDEATEYESLESLETIPFPAFPSGDSAAGSQEGNSHTGKKQMKVDVEGEQSNHDAAHSADSEEDEDLATDEQEPGVLTLELEQRKKDIGKAKLRLWMAFIYFIVVFTAFNIFWKVALGGADKDWQKMTHAQSISELLNAYEDFRVHLTGAIVLPLMIFTLLSVHSKILLLTRTWKLISLYVRMMAAPLYRRYFQQTKGE